MEQRNGRERLVEDGTPRKANGDATEDMDEPRANTLEGARFNTSSLLRARAVL